MQHAARHAGYPHGRAGGSESRQVWLSYLDATDDGGAPRRVQWRVATLDTVFTHSTDANASDLSPPARPARLRTRVRHSDGSTTGSARP